MPFLEKILMKNSSPYSQRQSRSRWAQRFLGAVAALLPLAAVTACAGKADEADASYAVTATDTTCDVDII